MVLRIEYPNDVDIRYSSSQGTICKFARGLLTGFPLTDRRIATCVVSIRLSCFCLPSAWIYNAAPCVTLLSFYKYFVFHKPTVADIIPPWDVMVIVAVDEGDSPGVYWSLLVWQVGNMQQEIVGQL